MLRLNFESFDNPFDYIFRHNRIQSYDKMIAYEIYITPWRWVRTNPIKKKKTRIQKSLSREDIMVERQISGGLHSMWIEGSSRGWGAGQRHLAWTQVFWSLFVQGRRMDPRILFVRNSGQGQLQKPPRFSGPDDRRAFLALGKRIS